MREKEVQAFVYRRRAEDVYLAGRTLRSLRAAGIEAREIPEPGGRTFRKIIAAESPVLFVRAGVWLASPGSYTTPRASASGKPLCALGAVRVRAHADATGGCEATMWRSLLEKSGGDFSRWPESNDGWGEILERPAALFLDARACAALHESNTASLREAADLMQTRFRRVHYSPLDVYSGEALRVLQVITALQRGGAERLTLDLVRELPREGSVVQLATIGTPPREAFRMPAGTIDCARLANDPEERLAILRQQAVAFGADVIHAHLLSRGELCALSAAGFPVMLTLHNTREGWAPEIAELQPKDAALLVACSAAVETDAREAHLPIPIRTVRNGIDTDRFCRTQTRIQAGREWRKHLGFSEDDLVLISMANPRPQKRLHLLPGVLAAVQKGLPGRPVRLVFCGEAAPGKVEAEECVRQTEAEVHRLGLARDVRWTGSIAESADLLAAADVLVSISAHEGLSLAQLEALALGCHVVATNVGGAREIAWNNPSFHLVPAAATPETFAEAVVRVAAFRRVDAEAIGFPQDHWSSRTMAAQYRRLYPRVIASATRGTASDGVWLLTNNFSTGGAQSSARRLLLGLAAQGETVRAAIVEEDPDYPTAGTRALQSAGIDVVAIEPDGTADEIAALLLSAIDNAPPRAVVFWNLRPGIKLLLAEALVDIPVYDVSPGEMYFESLERCLRNCPPRQHARTPRDYAARLAGVIVKYEREITRAQSLLDRPVHVVPNGVPLVVRRSRGPSQREAVVFGTAARINPQKRLEELIAAFRIAAEELRNTTLLIAGGIEHECDVYAEQLRAMAQDLPIHWLGDASDVAMLHEQLDIFVMISHPAGCPNASLEAMAAGLPVIATDVGGASEQVVDGVTGRLVPPGNPGALANAMVDLARQPHLWEAQGQAGRERIRTRFSVDGMVANYRRILLP